MTDMLELGVRIESTSTRINQLVIEVAKHVCAQDGLDPEGMYSMPAGVDDDGQYVFEEVPNYDRYVDGAHHAVEYVLGMDVTRLYAARRDYRERERAQNELMEAVNNADEAERPTGKEEIDLSAFE